jgi:hypothetical protein
MLVIRFDWMTSAPRALIAFWRMFNTLSTTAENGPLCDG